MEATVKHALIVEDSPINVAVLEMALKEFGISTQSVRDTNEARKILADTLFDISIIDQQLPSETGLEFVRDCVERSIHHRLGRIFIVTSDSIQDVEKKGLEDIIQGILSEPIDVDELEVLIKD